MILPTFKKIDVSDIRIDEIRSLASQILTYGSDPSCREDLLKSLLKECGRARYNNGESIPHCSSEEFCPYKEGGACMEMSNRAKYIKFAIDETT